MRIKTFRARKTIFPAREIFSRKHKVKSNFAGLAETQQAKVSNANKARERLRIHFFAEMPNHFLSSHPQRKHTFLQTH